MPSIEDVRKITPVPEGARLLHIGPAKTGTTALQTALHTNRAAMSEHGVTYAGSVRHSRSAAMGAAYDRIPVGYPRDGHRQWRLLAREVRNSEAKRVVISSEILARLTQDRARQVLADIGGDVHVVLTMRPLPDILASRWQQSVQNELAQSYSDFLHNLFRTTPDADGRPGFWRRYDLAAQVQRWGPLIGEQNLIFVILDPADRGMLLRSFEGLLALPTGTLAPSTRRTNPSLGHPEVAMLSSFNEAFLEHGHPRREFVQAMRRKALVEIKSDPTKLGTERIKTPRWAAELANEAATDWLAAVHTSGVRVVGRPEHLLVDPNEYEEDPVSPTELSTESAGLLAFQLYRAGLRYGEQQGRAALAKERAERAASRAASRESTGRGWRRKIAERIRPSRG